MFFEINKTKFVYTQRSQLHDGISANRENDRSDEFEAKSSVVRALVQAALVRDTQLGLSFSLDFGTAIALNRL